MHTDTWSFTYTESINCLATVLVTEIFTAWSLYVEKRDYFFQLSEFHKEHIPIWYHLPKEPELVNGKITKSVYCHSILVKGDLVIIFLLRISYIDHSSFLFRVPEPRLLQTNRLSYWAFQSNKHILFKGRHLYTVKSVRIF